MQSQGSGFPRVMVSALRGGSGKTLLSIGIAAALKACNETVAPFKKGPDYIDAGWLALAAGRPCYNLDTFLIPPNRVLHTVEAHCRTGDIAVIEGNRGLYDSSESQDNTSTAFLAKLLKAPVLLVVDCTKATRTLAAVVLGCLQFDPDVPIKGIILNRLAGSRHESVIRSSIEDHCRIPVVGAIGKLKKEYFPERHMGLVPTPEHTWAANAVKAARKVAAEGIDLERVLALARGAGELPVARATMPGSSSAVTPSPSPERTRTTSGGRTRLRAGTPPRIGILRDAAFSFYYPDNIDALVAAGAKPVYISPLHVDRLPPVDALYIGGGFPETHGEQLAENGPFREQIKALAEEGLPIYAECGGLMFLGEALVLEDRRYPMVGVFPVVFGVSSRPQGHGYTIARVQRENPYYEVGAEIRGHEFHYSRVLFWEGPEEELVFGMTRGRGFINGKDGLCYQRVLATFTHIHALGVPSWAEAMVRNAKTYQGGSSP